ncbi:phosphoesterase [Gracilibacillus boraciitolerans JCM 21714]|uniref:Phosphoesterase n=1 Tax=Gracilibacillus boraciitolerans JCM 21714 TaxID=1298598 RepID=W4VHM9_9BACI|nr:metallophosphoesterase [Gracilibacillus boraciitolerans]GAE92666.1 phosphoesterase [Gracilibacillus boraciitolerans JCM 21714]
MAKVLIISDSHGWSQEVSEIKARHQNEVDAMIHCGDSELEYDSEPLEGFEKVQGNMDRDFRFPEELDFSVGKLHFFVTHGHLFQIKSTLMPASYRAEELGANIICVGHAHVAAVEKVNDQLFINPGSLRQPRSSYPGSYALLTADDQLEDVSVHFYTKEGQEISSLAYQTSLTNF